MHLLSKVWKHHLLISGLLVLSGLQPFTPEVLIGAKQVKENALVKPLNHSLLLLAIRGNPMENIRRLRRKQTVCCLLL